MLSVTAASPNGVVISEFRFRGPAGANDEFVELRNGSSASIDLGGGQIVGCNASGSAISGRATAPEGLDCSDVPGGLFDRPRSPPR